MAKNDAQTPENLATEAAAKLAAETAAAETAAAETAAAETAAAEAAAEAAAAEAAAKEVKEDTKKQLAQVTATVFDLRDPYAVVEKPEDAWLRVGTPKEVEVTNWLKSQIDAGYAAFVE